MRAVRKSDHYYFELCDECYDRDGNDYLWKDLILIPNENEEVHCGPKQERTQELRERYVGMAMQGIISTSEISILKHKEEAVKEAIEFADALIEQLNKKI